MSQPLKDFYQFGPFRLDAIEQQLWREGEEISLTPKAFGVLLTLVRNSGRALTKEEFMREVWPDTIVEEKNLADNISILRQALGDDAQNPAYIKTIPKRGYRFVGVVERRGDASFDLSIHETSRAKIVIQDGVVSSPVETIPPNNLVSGRKSRAPLFAVIAICCIALVTIGALIYRSRRDATSSTDPAKSPQTIAVLPFRPLVSENRDPALEIGMTDALITKLSNISQIIVRPTTSVLKYTNEGQDLRAIGSELGADVLLDGKVQKDGDRVRLSVQLVRAADGATIWGEAFDENFTNVFAVQEQVSQKVAAALSLKLTGEEERGLSKRYTDSAEAYHLYLKGQHHWRTFQSAGLVNSLNYYNEALKKDPGYALAFSGLANSYTVIALYGPIPAKECMPKAQEAVQKALALDESLAETYVAVGALKIMYERDWAGAEKALKRAMELDPKSPNPHTLYGYYLEAMDRADEAVLEFKRATELEPNWALLTNDLLEGYFDARQYDEAIKHSREILRLEPANSRANQVLGMALTMKGQYDEAIPALQRAVETGGEHGRPKALTQLGYTYAVSGRRDDAYKVIEELKKDPNPWLAFHLARVYVGLGEHEKCFDWLEKAAAEQFGFLYDMRFLSQFDPVRSHPRFARLLRDLNLGP